jgi:hypothetical protein
VKRLTAAVVAFLALNIILLASITYVRHLVGGAPDASLAVAVLFCVGQVIIVAGTIWLPIQHAIEGSK